MARAKTKTELIKAAESNYKTLWEIISGMTKQEMETPFDFSRDAKKTEAHWKRDKISVTSSFIFMNGTGFYCIGLNQTDRAIRYLLFRNRITGKRMEI